METIAIIAILIVFVGLPVYLRSNMLLVLGMLALGWVLVYVTNNEAILYARSLSPVGGNNVDLVTSLVLGFSPALAAVLITKGSIKKILVRGLGILLVPAILATAWLSILFAVSYDTRIELLQTDINSYVDTYQAYALWAAAIVAVLYMYFVRVKKSKDEK